MMRTLRQRIASLVRTSEGAAAPAGAQSQPTSGGVGEQGLRHHHGGPTGESVRDGKGGDSSSFKHGAQVSSGGRRSPVDLGRFLKHRGFKRMFCLAAVELFILNLQATQRMVRAWSSRGNRAVRRLGHYRHFITHSTADVGIEYPDVVNR